MPRVVHFEINATRNRTGAIAFYGDCSDGSFRRKGAGSDGSANKDGRTPSPASNRRPDPRQGPSTGRRSSTSVCTVEWRLLTRFCQSIPGPGADDRDAEVPIPRVLVA